MAMTFVARMKSLIEVGAFGSITISAVGDFLAPKGGWLLTLTAGFLGLALLIYSLLCPAEKNKLHKLTEDEGKASHWWDGALWRQHGIHVLIIFTLVCITVGCKSYASADEGGILGSHFGAVADAQSMAGLLQESVMEERKTQKGIEHLSSIVKKETSDNPREQLANLGVAWSGEAFHDAIQNHDLSTIELFLRGEMPLRYSGDLAEFFKPGNKKMLALFEKYTPTVLSGDICFVDLDDLTKNLNIEHLRGLAADDEATMSLRKVCQPFTSELRNWLHRDVESLSGTNYSGTPEDIKQQEEVGSEQITKLQLMKKMLGI